MNTKRTFAPPTVMSTELTLASTMANSRWQSSGDEIYFYQDENDDFSLREIILIKENVIRIGE